GDLAHPAVLAAELTLHGNRDVDVQSAVDRAGVEVRRVLLRNSQLDAAVAGLDVESFTAPRRAIEIDVHAAVARAPLHVAREPRELHTPVDRPELDLPLDIVDADSPVGRLQGER